MGNLSILAQERAEDGGRALPAVQPQTDSISVAF